jgi:hypothetical protein
MSVTRTSTGQFCRTGNRNGPDLVCQCCYEIAPVDQPVYLGSFHAGIWTWHLPVCAACWVKGDPVYKLLVTARDYRGEAHIAGFKRLVGGGQREPSSCAWCERPVVTGLRAQHVACSESCRVQAYRQRVRQDRVDHPDSCQQCGAAMPGCRRGRQFCSSACRQKAYRQRMTDRDSKRAMDAALLREYNQRLQ